MNKTAKTNGRFYELKKGEKYLFQTSKNWTNCLVEKLDEDKYKLFVATPRTQFQKKVLSEKDTFRKYCILHDMDSVSWYISRYGESAFGRGMRKMMDSFGQKVMIKLYKNNFQREQALNYIGSVKIVKKAEVYKHLVVKEKLNPGTFVELLGDLTETDEVSGIQKFKYKNWKVFVEEKTKVSGDDIKKFLDTVTRKLNSESLGSLTGHKVHFVYAMSGSHTLADYSVSQKEIRVKVKKKLTKEHIHSIIHELGHKHYYEDLDKDQKSEIAIKFRKLKGSTSFTDLDIGDIVQDKRSKDVFQIEDYKKGGYICSVLENNSGRLKENLKYKIPMEGIGSGMEILKSKRKQKNNAGDFFVSSYSATSAEEFYAELFADFILGGIKPEPFQWISDVHAGHLENVNRR